MKRMIAPIDSKDPGRRAGPLGHAMLLGFCLYAGSHLLVCSQDLGQQPTVGIGARPGFPGQTTVVPVTAFNLTNVVAAQFDFSFDPAHCALADTQPASGLTNHVFRSHELSPGLWRVLIYSLSNLVLDTNAPLAAVAMSIPAHERVGSGPLNPRNIVLAQADATALAPVQGQAGAVFVSQVYRNRSSGEVRVFFPSKPSQRYLLQATTDFVNWVTLGTNLANAEFIDLVDVDSRNYPYRYYRLANYDALRGGTVGGMQSLPGGTASFYATGWESRTYEILASTNLVDWAALGTGSVTNGHMLFLDPDAAMFSRRFYRLRSQE